jgi:hypothetical protein
MTRNRYGVPVPLVRMGKRLDGFGTPGEPG